MERSPLAALLDDFEFTLLNFLGKKWREDRLIREADQLVNDYSNKILNLYQEEALKTHPIQEWSVLVLNKLSNTYDTKTKTFGEVDLHEISQSEDFNAIRKNVERVLSNKNPEYLKNFNALLEPGTKVNLDNLSSFFDKISETVPASVDSAIYRSLSKTVEDMKKEGTLESYLAKPKEEKKVASGKELMMNLFAKTLKADQEKEGTLFNLYAKDYSKASHDSKGNASSTLNQSVLTLSSLSYFAVHKARVEEKKVSITKLYESIQSNLGRGLQNKSIMSKMPVRTIDGIVYDPMKIHVNSLQKLEEVNKQHEFMEGVKNEQTAAEKEKSDAIKKESTQKVITNYETFYDFVNDKNNKKTEKIEETKGYAQCKKDVEKSVEFREYLFENGQKLTKKEKDDKLNELTLREVARVQAYISKAKALQEKVSPDNIIAVNFDNPKAKESFEKHVKVKSSDKKLLQIHQQLEEIPLSDKSYKDKVELVEATMKERNLKFEALPSREEKAFEKIKEKTEKSLKKKTDERINDLKNNYTSLDPRSVANLEKLTTEKCPKDVDLNTALVFDKKHIMDYNNKLINLRQQGLKPQTISAADISDKFVHQKFVDNITKAWTPIEINVALSSFNDDPYAFRNEEARKIAKELSDGRKDYQTFKQTKKEMLLKEMNERLNIMAENPAIKDAFSKNPDFVKQAKDKISKELLKEDKNNSLNYVLQKQTVGKEVSSITPENFIALQAEKQENKVGLSDLALAMKDWSCEQLEIAESNLYKIPLSLPQQRTAVANQFQPLLAQREDYKVYKENSKSPQRDDGGLERERK